MGMLVAACGGGGGSSGSTTGPSSNAGPFSFSALPIALDAFYFITPMGNLNPPSHALPTDHIYFYFANGGADSPAARRTAFIAPADGTVRDVIINELPDVKVEIQATSSIVYFVDHLIPEITLAAGTRVTAGQRLGTTGSVLAVDLGVRNANVTLTGLLNLSRYPDSGTVHTDGPLKFFAEPLRSQLYAKVQRIGPDLDGKIDFDVAGRLSGNWFDESDATPLAFAYDTYDPAQVRISINAGVSLPGVFAIAATDPQPRDVSVASGKVRYSLVPSHTGPPFPEPPSPASNRMLVQMLDDRRIRVEIVPQSASADDFTASARTYIR
jgi:hypothetical protein